MYSIYTYSNLIQPITELQNQIQRITQPFSGIIEMQNKIHNIFYPLSNTYIYGNIIDVNNTLSKNIKQILNKTNNQAIPFITQPTSIINNITRQNIMNIYNVVPPILPFLDISVLNNYIQDVCVNMPNDILIDFNEPELNIIEKIQAYIKAYNANPNTKIKIKLPINKKKIFAITIAVVIVIYLNRLGYFDTTTHLPAIIDGFIASALFDYFKQIK